MTSPSIGRPVTLTDRTLRGLLWMSGGTGAEALLKIVVLAILARLLTPTEFGMVGAAMVVIAFAQVFGRLGVGPAVVQRAELTNAHIRAAFTLAMGLSLTVGLIIYAAAPLFAALFRMDDLAPLIRVLALVFPVAGLGLVAEALLERKLQFKQLALRQVMSYALGYGAVGVCLASFGWGVWALVWAQIAQVISNTVLVLVAQRHPIAPIGSAKAYGDLVRFGSGYALSHIGSFGANQVDNFVVGRWMGAEALGFYGRAYQALTMPTTLIGSVLQRVLFPAMAEIQGENQRLWRAFIRTTGVVAMFSLPLSAALIVFAPEIVLVLLGPQWTAVIVPFQILAASVMFRTGGRFGRSVAKAKGAVYRLSWRTWMYLAAVFLGAYVGHFWGLPGVAVGVACAVAFNYLQMLHLIIRLIDGSWAELARIHLRHLCTAVLLGAIAWLAAEAARSQALHPGIVLILGLTTMVLCGLALMRFRQSVFGEDGTFLVTLLSKRLRQRT